MSTLPRALHRARLWAAGLLTASTVLVGAIGIHLADAQTQTVATQTSSGTSDSTSSNASSSSSSSDTSSDTSSSDDSSSGFSAVAPASGSNVQAQTNSGGS